MSYALLKALLCDICGEPYYGQLRELTIDGDESECIADYLMDLWASSITDQRSMAEHSGWRYEMETLDVKYGPQTLGVVRCPKCLERPHPSEIKQSDPELEHDRKCSECAEDPRSPPKESKCARRRFGHMRAITECDYDVPY